MSEQTYNIASNYRTSRNHHAVNHNNLLHQLQDESSQLDQVEDSIQYYQAPPTRNPKKRSTVIGLRRKLENEIDLDIQSMAERQTPASQRLLRAPEKLAPTSKKISKKIPNITPKDSIQLRRTWTKQEDELLLHYIKCYGQNWAMISQSMGGIRNGKQIRDRYLNKLNPAIKNTKWTPEEDQKLFELFQVFGRKWCRIAKDMAGRTEAMVKNRFYTKFEHYLNQSLKDQPISPRRKENGHANLRFLKTNKTFDSAQLLQKMNLQRRQQPVNIPYEEEYDPLDQLESPKVSEYLSSLGERESDDIYANSPELDQSSENYTPNSKVNFEEAFRDYVREREHGFEGEEAEMIDFSEQMKPGQDFPNYHENQSAIYENIRGDESGGMEIEPSEEVREAAPVEETNKVNEVNGENQEAGDLTDGKNFNELDKQAQIQILETRLSEVEKIFWSTLEEMKRLVAINAEKLKASE